MSSGSGIPISSTFWSARVCVCSTELCTCGARQDANSEVRDEITCCFLAHRRDVYNFLVHGLRCPHSEAEDLTQETFLRLYRARLDGRATINGSARPLLLTIARRLVLDRRRHDGVEHRLFGPLPENVEEAVADTTQETYEQLRARRERSADLKSAIDKLSVVERACLHLRAEGQSLRTIGKIVGLRENGVSRTVLRAIRRLQQQLNDAR
jgi:RNA polymerase sigma factor (sigma-70 family)